MYEFNARDLADMASVFGTAEQYEALLFAALAQTAELQVCKFSAHDASYAAWAFAKSGHT